MAEAMKISTPNRDAILADLRTFTARWGELDAPCWLEIRAFNKWGNPTISKWRHTDLEAAADWIVSLNATGRNVYAVRNPIRDACVAPATDDDIIAAFYLWADCDDAAAGANVTRFDGPKHTAAVVTGTIPTARAHVYWELSQPVRDLAKWRDTQQAIAAHFSSDRSVVNPSRIMRVGGTVSWPSDKKVERGYAPELTVLRTEYPADQGRAPITFERAQRVWPAAQPTLSQQAMAAVAQPAHAAPAGMFAFDMGTDHPASVDRPAVTASILAGSEWHNGMIRLVGSYVGKGMSDGEIHAMTQPLTLPGYSGDDTGREVQTAIDGARRKGWTPEPPEAKPFDFAPTADAAKPDAETWRIQNAADFIAGFVSPEWLVEGVLQRGRLYTLTAPTGHGKTAAMLHMGMAISAGNEFCGLETESGDVLFLAGENPDDVRARVIVGLEADGIDPASCRLHFIPGTFSIRQDMAALSAAAANLPDLALVVVDTFAAYFDGDDENSNAQALDFARVVRSMTGLPSRPAVVMPAHPVKNATRSNLTPKGGSSLLNEVDGNLTVYREEKLISMHWQGKIRGPEFEPLTLELTGATSEKVKDKRGRLMPSVVARPVLATRALQLADEANNRHDAALLNVARWPAKSVGDRAIDLGLVNGAGEPMKSTMQRILHKLREDKLIERFMRTWELTAGGRKAVDMIRNGPEMPSDA